MSETPELCLYEDDEQPFLVYHIRSCLTLLGFDKMSALTRLTPDQICRIISGTAPITIEHREQIASGIREYIAMLRSVEGSIKPAPRTDPPF